jgi:hypothetical protein
MMDPKVTITKTGRLVLNSAVGKMIPYVSTIALGYEVKQQNGKRVNKIHLLLPTHPKVTMLPRVEFFQLSKRSTGELSFNLSAGFEPWAKRKPNLGWYNYSKRGDKTFPLEIGTDSMSFVLPMDKPYKDRWDRIR